MSNGVRPVHFLLCLCGLIASSARASEIGFWAFTETGGAVAHDSSGSGVDGTLVGAAFDPGAGPAGGGAISLSYGGGYVTMGDKYGFSGLDTFSIQAWVRLSPGDTRTMAPVAKAYAGVVEGYGIYLGDPGTGSAYLNHGVAFEAGPGYSWMAPSPAVIDDGSWHQLVGVYGAATVSFYVDGVLQGYIPRISITASPGTDFIVGGQRWFPPGPDQNYFSGLISDVGVWDNALSLADVLSLYKDTLHPAPEPGSCLAVTLGLGLIALAHRVRTRRSY